MEHRWLDWAGSDEHPCVETRRCSRCAEEENRDAHAWGDWTYSEAHRSPVRHCDRCHAGISYLGAGVDVVPQSPAPPPVVESARTPSPDGDAEYRTMLAAIRAEYEAQVSRGQIAPSRRPRYTALLDDLEDVVAAPALDLASMQVRAKRIQEMLAGFASALMDPSRLEPAHAPEAGSRTARMLAYVSALHAYVMSEMGHSQLTGDTGVALGQFVSLLLRCRDALAAPMDEAQLRQLEIESVRPAALAIRQFSLREHLALARPVWPSPVVTQHPDAVFYAGGDDVLSLVRAACDERALRLLLPQRHREPASLRWNQLREASLAVFDFSRYERTPTPDDAAAIAAVAYEFGVALVLGRPAVIVADATRGLPFDLDITPVALAHDATDASHIADAIDDTLYGLQRAPAGSSVASTLTLLRAACHDHADMRVRTSGSGIDEDAARDPVRARLVASTILGYLGAEAPQMLFPTWPVAYPSTDARSCFHVTPFGPPWARQMRELVRAACPDDIQYVRGDQVLDPDIIRSIWDEICTATHIVVDLTGLNANVLVECGIAHALGRNVLLLSQDVKPEHGLRALVRHRVHTYALDTPDDREALQTTLRAFLAT
jgi:hypothetical protein